MKSKTTSGTDTIVKPRSFTLRVTDKVISEAKQNDSTRCMYARALRNLGANSVRVTKEWLRFNFEEHSYSYPLPVKGAIKLMAFERSKDSVGPHTLLLSGNIGFMRPIVRRPETRGRKIKQRKRNTAPQPKRDARRFHGVRVIMSPQQAA